MIFDWGSVLAGLQPFCDTPSVTAYAVPPPSKREARGVRLLKPIATIAVYRTGAGAPKAFPSGEGGTATAVTEEGILRSKIRIRPPFLINERQYRTSSVKNQRFLPAIICCAIATGNRLFGIRCAEHYPRGEALARCARCRTAGATQSPLQTAIRYLP